MKKTLYFLLFTATIFSCQKDKNLPSSLDVNSKISKEKKIFKNLEEFNNYIEKYNSDIIFRNSPNAEVSEDVLLLVEEDAFASIFNDEAEVSIADMTYKVTNVGTFFSLNENSSNINDYINIDSELVNELPPILPEEGPIPDFLIAAQPNLANANLVEEEEGIFYLGNGVYYKDGVEEEFFDNTSIDLNDAVPLPSNLLPTNPLANSNTQSFSYSSYFAPSVFDGIDLTSAKTVEYTKKNGEVLNNFSSKDRLVVQLKSKNFLIFSYVKASVRIDHKKKYWFGWRTLQNYDELRAGFVNLTLDYNLPSFANVPNNTPPNPIDGANKFLKKFFTIKIDNDPFDLYRLTDILTIPNLPWNIRNIVEDLLNNPEALYTQLINQQKNNAIQTLTNFVKTQLGNNITTKNNFSFAIPNNSYITIPLIEKKKTSTGAKIDYIFGFQTLMIGISGASIQDLNITYSPSKHPKIISGAAFGAGKLNGVWKSSVLVKKKN